MVVILILTRSRRLWQAAQPKVGTRELVELGRTHFQVWGKPNHLSGGSGVAR